MRYRILQFCRAFLGSISVKDHALLMEFLSPVEIDYFKQMSRGVQIHSLWVVKTLIQWRNQNLHQLGTLPEDDWRILVRGALFHDIGKPRHLKLADRIGIVLYQWIRRLFKKELPLPYRNQYQQNLLHPQKGEEIALALNFEPQVVEIIRDHHLGTSSMGRLSYYVALADQVN